MTLETFAAGRGSPRQIRDFLKLHKQLYPPACRTQNTKDLKALLENSHLLSKHFHLTALLLYKDKPVARCCLIRYEQVTYFGFLEAADTEAFHTLLDHAEALVDGKLVGPVNGSFWLGYRLRLLNERQAPFTGEPWQQAWYYDAFLERGYKVAERYYSNHFEDSLARLRRPPEKLRQRRDRALAKGYDLRQPRAEEWDSVLDEFSRLLLELYQEFPTFQPISPAEFRELFSVLKPLVAFPFVELAYKDDKLCGFAVTLPDYGNLPFRRLTPWTLLRILLRKRRAKHYIMLYLGVAPEHVGLGQALLFGQVEKILAQGSSLTAALIHEGKVTGTYGIAHVDQVTEYVLLSKTISQKN